MTRSVISARQPVSNLLYNGDFEYAPPFTAATSVSGVWVDGTASGSSTNSIYKWYSFAKTGSGTIQFDNTVSHSGAYSLKVSTTATGSTMTAATSGTSISLIQQSPISVLPSTSYTLSFWMKTTLNSGSAGTGALMRIRETSSTGSQVLQTNTTNVITTTGWTQYTSTFTTNASTQYIILRPDVFGTDGAATLIMDAWFDDITIAPTAGINRTTAGTRYPNSLSGLYFNNDVTQNTGVALTNIAALQSLTSVTVEAWVYLYGYPLSTSAKIFHFGGGGTTGYQLQMGTNGAITIQAANGTTSATSNGSPIIPKTTWTKVDGVWDGSSIYVFVNGVKVAGITLAAGTTGNPAVTPYIGNQAAGARAFPGIISEIRVSNIARHTADYTVEAGSLSPDANTVGLYHFFEGSGTTTADSSSQNNTGTLSNSPLPTWSLGRWPGGPSARLLA